MGTKNEPGEYDCYDNAEPDEPMFILLARDPFAPWLVRLWCSLRLEAGHRSHEKHAEARWCADAMEKWRKEHRDDNRAVRAYEALRRVCRWIGSGGMFG